MVAHYESIQHRWFDQVWNLGNENAIDELLDPDVVGHGLTDENGEEIRGIESFRAFYRQFRGAFPDIHIDVEHVIADGDFMVAHCRCTATHSGEGFVCPPTGKQVDFRGSCTIRIKDDRIAESWNFDFLTVMLQLGIISFPN
jgi:predicted ester cyclase